MVAQMVKNPPGNVEDLGSIPGLGTSSGEGNSYPLQYSGLENLQRVGHDWATSIHITCFIEVALVYNTI